MSEITEISGYNHLLQLTWKAHRWHAKVTGWARGAWGAWPSCHAGLGTCPEPSGVPGAQAPDGRTPLHTTSVCNVRVCVTNNQNIISSFTTLNPQPGRKPVSMARDFCKRGGGGGEERKKPKTPALRVLCDRFFLLQLGKAIRIHLISEVLVIGILISLLSLTNILLSPVVGNCIPTASPFVLPDGKDVYLPFSLIQLVP